MLIKNVSVGNYLYDVSAPKGTPYNEVIATIIKHSPVEWMLDPVGRKRTQGVIGRKKYYEITYELVGWNRSEHAW